MLGQQPPQREAAALVGAPELGEADGRLAVVGLLGQELVDAGLQLGGDAGEGQAAHRRTGTPAAPHRGPEAAAAPGHQALSPSAAGPVARAQPAGVGLPRRLGLHLGQHLGVEGGGGEQLGVGAVGHHPSAVEQHDAVGEADGGEPVGDDQGRAPLHEAS